MITYTVSMIMSRFMLGDIITGTALADMSYGITTSRVYMKVTRADVHPNIINAQTLTVMVLGYVDQTRGKHTYAHHSYDRLNSEMFMLYASDCIHVKGSNYMSEPLLNEDDKRIIGEALCLR